MQRIRAAEEHKQHRRKQVEKMKFDMLHMQLHPDVPEANPSSIELDDCGGPLRPSPSPFRHKMNTPRSIERIASELADARKPDPGPVRGLSFDSQSPTHIAHSDGSDEEYVGTRRRKNALKAQSNVGTDKEQPEEANHSGKLRHAVTDSAIISQTVAGMGIGSPKLPTSRSLESERLNQQTWNSAIPGLMSGVHILEEGVAQVQSLGNKALANLVGLLSTDDQNESGEAWSADDAFSNMTVNERQEEQQAVFNAAPATPVERTYPSGWSNMWTQLCMLCYYSFCQMRGNTDIVCYFFFLVVYVWNFSFLTLVFPAALFLYALLVNPGPSKNFWLAMLIYTELNILLQYCYQIRATHCDPITSPPSWLRELGIPGSLSKHSFVVNVLPLFLVYLATLMQSSIKAQDGEWMFVNESNSFVSSRRLLDPEGQVRAPRRLSPQEKLWKSLDWVIEIFRRLIRGTFRYWQALTSGSEAPPHFVQVSMEVDKWPEAGIQPERIESACNRLLAAIRFTQIVSGESLDKTICSRVRVESIESSPDKTNTALAVLEVIYAAPCEGSSSNAHYSSLTPAADVAAEFLKAKEQGFVESTGFPYHILSVIPGGKREVDLYAYIFGADLLAFLYVAVIYQSFVKNSPQLLGGVIDQFPKDFIFVLMVCFPLSCNLLFEHVHNFIKDRCSN